jgi:hypothetical protein
VIWLVGGVALVVAGLAGVAMGRSRGWDAGLHRAVLAALLLPWAAQHGSLVRLSRSRALNPPDRAAAEAGLLPGDWVAPAVVAVALLACWLLPRRLRGASVLLPLLASALTWWVTLPLYAASRLRGWFFVTEGLAGPWPFVYHLAAAAFLAGWVLPTFAAGGEPGGPRGRAPSSAARGAMDGRVDRSSRAGGPAGPPDGPDTRPGG